MILIKAADIKGCTVREVMEELGLGHLSGDELDGIAEHLLAGWDYDSLKEEEKWNYRYA